MKCSTGAVCGRREPLALTPGDFDLKKRTVTISKFYQRIKGRDVVVQGNPRVYKALRNELAAGLAELQRIEVGGGVDGEMLDTIELITVTLGDMRED